MASPLPHADKHGTLLLSQLLPQRRFPYAKSLYAVEDVLRFYLARSPDAVVVDFFAGSGTTVHAVMRLNRQDGGRRQCIGVTNNEVAPDEAKRLRGQGWRPGDAEWERSGICEYITKPRLRAGAKGRRVGEAKAGYDVADTYAVLFNLDASRDFLAAVAEAQAVRTAFVVTDDERGFQTVCAELPGRVEGVRLYESYLANFRANAAQE